MPVLAFIRQLCVQILKLLDKNGLSVKIIFLIKFLPVSLLFSLLGWRNSMSDSWKFFTLWWGTITFFFFENALGEVFSIWLPWNNNWFCLSWIKKHYSWPYSFNILVIKQCISWKFYKYFKKQRSKIDYQDHMIWHRWTIFISATWRVNFSKTIHN